MTLRTVLASLRWPFARTTDAERATRATATAVYVGAVIVAGVVLLVRSAPRTYPDPYLAAGLLTAALVLSFFKLRLPLGRGNSTMSMAQAADFVALMMVGANLAMVIAAAGVLLQCTVRVKRRQPLHRTAFSVASVVVAVQVAGWVWEAFGGDVHVLSISTIVVPLSAAAMTYFAANTVLVAVAIALSTSASALREWYREFFWSAPAYFLSAAVATIVALVLTRGAYVLLPLAAAPLYLSYRAYKMSVRRIEEERRHAQELAGMIATTQQALSRATQSEAALAAEKERLALERARLAITLSTIGDGVVTVDRRGNVILLNDAAQKLGAVRVEDITRRPVLGLLTGLALTKATCQHALDRVLREGIPVRLRNDPSPADPTARFVEITGTPTRDADGEVAGAVWVFRDITDETRVEQEREKAARLESLGVLAGGLAHDFNNILMGVVGNLSLVQGMIDEGQSAVHARLANAAAACARARGVTNQLLTFSKGGAPVKTTASVRELVTECTRFALSGSPVAPKFGIAEDLWVADVDTGQVGQVIQNLTLNAMQAMPGGGVLNVSLENVTLTAETIPPQTAMEPGDYVRLTVEDSGTGMPPEVLGRIFDPYFSTKETGSGLGLAISYSIITAHGGGITVSSEVGVGSRFDVYLPANKSGLVQTAAVTRTEPARTRTGRILIMDDEDMVAEVAQEMFECLGYQVKRTASGTEAIEVFREAEQGDSPFDICIFDLTVPGGMGGKDAVVHIREIRADATVLVMSGYADDAVLARYGDYGFDAVLPKPFVLADLRRVLQEVQGAPAEKKAAPADTCESELIGSGVAALVS